MVCALHPKARGADFLVAAEISHSLLRAHWPQWRSYHLLILCLLDLLAPPVSSPSPESCCLLSSLCITRYCCHQDPQTTDTDEEYGVVITQAYAVISTKQSSLFWWLTSSHYLFLLTNHCCSCGQARMLHNPAVCSAISWPTVECGAGWWHQGHGQCSMWRLGGGWIPEPEPTLNTTPSLLGLTPADMTLLQTK